MDGVLADIVTEWPAYREWSHEYLNELCGDYTFNAGVMLFV